QLLDLEVLTSYSNITVVDFLEVDELVVG
ncbi:hypothetical protein Tco_0381510, partial [Tanacetum coccineum]